MERYTLRDAQAQLDKLIADAQSGKKIFIVDEHNRTVQLIPAKSTREPGSARGKIRMSDDFDAPLSDFDDYTP